ncbi:2,3-bisphosphoglycerate-independent phosphoglycerate mutase [Candidatus Gracilibacteria bacterium]|nr:2,3-bisphosphoglycerate-independent phosphoglycerate mutase [Candidatus Gracilibacteria bacterium]
MNNTLLVILDGFGEGPAYPGNAVTRAATSTIPWLNEHASKALLTACGEAVGIPVGTQGGSEVGHFTMGAGRRVFQTLEAINRSITDGSFFKKPELVSAFEHIKNTKGARLHLMGMISDQGIHAHTNHLFALLQMAKDQGVQEIFIHAVTDGRDVPERSAAGFITRIQEEISRLGLSKQAKIASIMGRYYAMDRDANWDRTRAAYELLTEGKGAEETDPLAAIEHAYERGAHTDYYLAPMILEKDGLVKNEDAMIIWNFRTDRLRQLTWAFTGEKNPRTGEPIGFTPTLPIRPFVVCMGHYSHVAPVVFPTPVVVNNLATVLSHNNLKQFHLAETEKYAHVTYFFNSQIEDPLPGEDRLMIASPKCPSYAEKPAMSAQEITHSLTQKLSEKNYEFIVVNFANCDLVGHSGNLTSAIKAVEVVDECLGKVLTAAKENGYTTLITGDHGNVEYMLYDDGTPCPSHTKNPVPLYLVDPTGRFELKQKKGELAQIAPTILAIMGVSKPAEMTGESLI